MTNYSSTMRRKFWGFHCFVVVGCCLVVALQAILADTAIPVTSLSPPEGNTTFLGGTTWCVALAGVPQVDLQNALDWACGPGKADCRPIQSGGRCFEPNTVVHHASYAFNNYYQRNGNSDIACNFGGTATMTKNDPSYDKCAYDASESINSSAPQPSNYKPSTNWWKLAMILLLLHMGS